MKKRLDNNYYWCAQECIDDINQVFQNCYTYNKKGEDVSLMAETIEKLFNTKLKNMPPVEVAMNMAEKKAKSAKSSVPPRSKKVLPPGAVSGYEPRNASPLIAPPGLGVMNKSSNLPDGSMLTPALPAHDLAPSMFPGANKVGSRRDSRPIKSEGLSRCTEILREMFSKKHSAYAWPFYKPVDAEQLGLHDYHKIITRPMDLGTVKMNLDNGIYNSTEEFAQDVRQIFINCYTYNPETHDVVAMARKLSNFFEEKMREINSGVIDVKPKVEDFNNFNHQSMPPAGSYPAPSGRAVKKEMDYFVRTWFKFHVWLSELTFLVCFRAPTTPALMLAETIGTEDCFLYKTKCNS